MATGYFDIHVVFCFHLVCVVQFSTKFFSYLLFLFTIYRFYHLVGLQIGVIIRKVSMLELLFFLYKDNVTIFCGLKQGIETHLKKIITDE